MGPKRWMFCRRSESLKRDWAKFVCNQTLVPFDSTTGAFPSALIYEAELPPPHTGNPLPRGIQKTPQGGFRAFFPRPGVEKQLPFGGYNPLKASVSKSSLYVSEGHRQVWGSAGGVENSWCGPESIE